MHFTFHSTTYGVDVYLKLIQHGQRINIGLVDFVPASADIKEADLARKIQEVVRYDLLFTRYFNITDLSYRWTGKKSEFELWRRSGADVFLTGRVELKKDFCRLKAELYDAESGDLIFEKTIDGTLQDYRTIGHILNDEIVLRFTGEKGIAQTKIAFANDMSGYKEIYVIDYDGYNLRQLTFDKSINIFPKWSKNSQIAFCSYKFTNPDLYVIDSDGSNRRAVSIHQGLNTTPAWSPDGKTIVLTLSKGKSPNLYHIDLSGKITKQITYGSGINTSPCFAPNSREIVFISDKSGIPQLYLTDIEGVNTRKIYTDGYCDSPAWSPKGDKIAFAQRLKGASFFDIYLYDISTGKISQLTFNSGSNENPSFSPDGRFIAFISTRNGKRELFLMFLNGSGQMRLADIKGNSFTPSWSY
ncbi:MAG: hypothetical protein QME68_02885 [Elusimicrobiota bacterium]|nr:hypothetical protein [Elusimicrobiota bacterium]